MNVDNLPNTEVVNKYKPLGFEIIKRTPTSVEAIACIFCENTGKFKTKVLTIRRELNENDYHIKNKDYQYTQHRTQED